MLWLVGSSLIDLKQTTFIPQTVPKLKALHFLQKPIKVYHLLYLYFKATEWTDISCRVRIQTGEYFMIITRKKFIYPYLVTGVM